MSPSRMATDVPEHCAMALKEWAEVCAALREGRQCLLLRKGGIAEESGDFRPERDAFWLYPTYLHQGQQGVRGVDRVAAPPGGDPVRLDTFAVVTGAVHATRLESVLALAPWHILTEETVVQRFHYRRPGLWVLLLRVFAGGPAWEVEVTPEQAGCKSWVPLEQPLATSGVRPVLDDAEARRRCEAIRGVLAGDRAEGEASQA